MLVISDRLSIPPNTYIDTLMHPAIIYNGLTNLITVSTNDFLHLSKNTVRIVFMNGVSPKYSIRPF